MPVSEQTYERVALEDPEGRWELVCGRLRRKPDMTTEHENLIDALDVLLKRQLPWEEYSVRPAHSRLRITSGTHYIPDLCVIPRRLIRERLTGRPRRLEEYDQPMPLVVEVWSRGTGAYDVTSKLPEYQQRGDLEIWLLHPYDRTLTVWRRQPDHSYVRSTYRHGVVRLVALPGVSIDLDDLFAMV